MPRKRPVTVHLRVPYRAEVKHFYSGEKAGLEDGNADLSPFLGKHLRFGDWRQRRKN